MVCSHIYTDDGACRLKYITAWLSLHEQTLQPGARAPPLSCFQGVPITRG